MLAIRPELDMSDVFIAAWLPGSEGGGIADFLFGTDGFTPKEKSPYSWPVNVADLPLAPDAEHALFQFGYGLEDYLFSSRFSTQTANLTSGGFAGERFGSARSTMRRAIQTNRRAARGIFRFGSGTLKEILHTKPAQVLYLVFRKLCWPVPSRPDPSVVES